MDFSSIEQLSTKTIVRITSGCSSTIFPGTLYMFLFERDLFKELDFFKLLLITIAISSPIWLLNFILSIFITFNKKCPNGNLDKDILFFETSIITSLVLYTTIGVKNVYPSFELYGLCSSEIVSFFILYILLKKLNFK